MKSALTVLTLAAMTALTGCVSQTQFLDNKQGPALGRRSKVRFQITRLSSGNLEVTGRAHLINYNKLTNIYLSS